MPKGSEKKREPRCAVCASLIKPGHLMCKVHWMRTPAALRDEIMRPPSIAARFGALARAIVCVKLAEKQAEQRKNQEPDFFGAA